MSRQGKPNKASAAREARWSEEGRTPLDVMQMAMNYFAKQADQLMAIDVKRMTKGQRLKHDRLVEAALIRASGIAEKAAPYVHSRITAMKVQGDELKPLKVIVKYV